VAAHKTEKLYLTDPCLVAFQARVLECGRSGDGRPSVILDRTCFFPESGGQTADTGTIADFTVVDVQEAGEDGVVHYVEPDAGVPESLSGSEVSCLVDEKRRFDHMQQHTGQHLLSRAFIEVGGLHTVSFHMGEETCTIDLEGSGFDAGVVRRAEQLANDTIVKNLPVAVRTMPVDQARDLAGAELRRAIPEGVTEARLVEVEGFDVIPCCGTHVAATGELGVAKVVKSEKVKGWQRVYFKVGQRAVRDYAGKHDIVQTLGNRLTTSSADIAARVDKLVAEGQQARKDIRRLSAALAGYEAQALLAENTGEGTRVIVRYFADRDDAYLRLVSGALKDAPRTVSILAAATGGVVCSASAGVDIDFTATAVEPVRKAGGSGGGKGAFAQLKLPGGADVKLFLEEIADNVRNSLE
jgi:alanyl-tRNA synthetase